MAERKQMNELVELIGQWFRDRGLNHADPKSQMLKLSEEVGELAGAIARDDWAEMIDAIGDITVVLIGISEIMNYDYTCCVASAYDVIKDRKGMLVNGIWLKESDYMTELEYTATTTVNEVDLFTDGEMHMDNGVVEVVTETESYPLKYGDVIKLNTITKQLSILKKSDQTGGQ